MPVNVPIKDINTPKVLKLGEKVLISIFAGVAPIATKFLARDNAIPLSELMEIYISTAICLIFLAFVICYLSKEADRMKLFMLALSAPALISNMSSETNLSGTLTPSGNKASLIGSIVTVAHADDRADNYQ